MTRPGCSCIDFSSSPKPAAQKPRLILRIIGDAFRFQPNLRGVHHVLSRRGIFRHAHGFQADGSLDEEVNRQLVEMQIEGGLDGIFPVSSSGESVAMDSASRCRLMDIVREQTAGRAAVLPGIPGCAPEEALALGPSCPRMRL